MVTVPKDIHHKITTTKGTLYDIYDEYARRRVVCPKADGKEWANSSKQTSALRARETLAPRVTSLDLYGERETLF